MNSLATGGPLVGRHSIPSSVLVPLVAALALIIAACGNSATDDDLDAGADDGGNVAAETDDSNDDHGSDHEATLVPPDAEMFAEGTEFPDDVRAELRLKLEEPDGASAGQHGGRETFERLIDDGSTVNMGVQYFPAEEDGEISGVPWHTHPAPFIVVITDGALTITWETDCKPRTYGAGQAFIDLGQEAHKAENLSGEETVAYFMGIGFPEDEPFTHFAADHDDFEEPC